MLPDLIALSHLRWNFVFHRPHHLMTRFARERRVFYIEEPIVEGDEPRLVVKQSGSGVHVAIPHVPPPLSAEEVMRVQRASIDRLVHKYGIDQHVLWYCTPMGLPYTAHLSPLAVVYDCMEELSLLRGAPPELHAYESALFRHADVVFTGGHSLYLSKRELHRNVHAFPSSVDFEHFARARRIRDATAEVAGIPRPRLGFCGVIDERLDLDLLSAIADGRPDWHLVMIGPVMRIDAATLPVRPNIHYLGRRAYHELPAYLAAWDVALLPFALNDTTRYASPVKTPEYLAAGKPVVSTPIADVVRVYGDRGLVRIARTPEMFVAAIEGCLGEHASARQEAADHLLGQMSWDLTFDGMKELMDQAVEHHRTSAGDRCSIS